MIAVYSAVPLLHEAHLLLQM